MKTNSHPQSMPAGSLHMKLLLLFIYCFQIMNNKQITYLKYLRYLLNISDFIEIMSENYLTISLPISF